MRPRGTAGPDAQRPARAVGGSYNGAPAPARWGRGRCADPARTGSLGSEQTSDAGSPGCSWRQESEGVPSTPDPPTLSNPKATPSWPPGARRWHPLIFLINSHLASSSWLVPHCGDAFRACPLSRQAGAPTRWRSLPRNTEGTFSPNLLTPCATCPGLLTRVTLSLGFLVPHLTQALHLRYGFLSIFLRTSSDRVFILSRNQASGPSGSPTPWPESSVHQPWKSRPLAAGDTPLCSGKHAVLRPSVPPGGCGLT